MYISHHNRTNNRNAANTGPSVYRFPSLLHAGLGTVAAQRLKSIYGIYFRYRNIRAGDGMRERAVHANAGRRKHTHTHIITLDIIALIFCVRKNKYFILQDSVLFFFGPCFKQHCLMVKKNWKSCIYAFFFVRNKMQNILPTPRASRYINFEVGWGRARQDDKKGKAWQ